MSALGTNAWPMDTVQTYFKSALRNLKTTLFFSYFEIKKQTAGSGLGLAWMVLDPLVRVLIYVFVFAFVLQIRLPGPDATAFSYSVYILMGLLPWMYMSSVLSDGAGLVHSYAGFIRQPNFPYRILPNVVLLKQLPAHLVSMTVVFVMIGIAGDLGKISIPLLILVYAMMFTIIRGAATFLGACAAVLPDVRQVLQLVLTMAIYLSPIVYLPAQLGRWIVIGLLNPFSYVLTSFKYALTGEARYTMLGPLPDMAIMAALAVGFAILERAVLRRIRHTGIDRVV